MDQIIDNLYIANVFEVVPFFTDPKDFVACLSIGTEFVESEVYKRTFLSPKTIKHMIFKLHDQSSGIKQFIDAGIEFIDSNIKDGKMIVHCSAGVSRSPSMVFAYLISKGYDPIKAFELITSKRKVACPYIGFIKDILEHFQFEKAKINEVLKYVKSGCLK